jgi:pimeloyl-ACP methyl ester carboxylesterase
MANAVKASHSSQKSTNVRLKLLRFFFRFASKIAPRTTIAMVEYLFSTPRRSPVPAREREWSNSARSFYVFSEDTRLRVFSWGAEEAPTIVLVHGWEGRGLQLGAFAEPLVAAGFRVVAFDAPGHGDSSGRRSAPIEIARALRAVARHLGGVEAVVAHSLGTVGTSLAVRQGLAVERLVYIAPVAFVDRFLFELEERLGTPRALLERVRERLERRFGLPWRELEIRELARHAHQPLLIVHDRDDREVPFLDGRELFRSWPGARLLATSGLGHRRILREEKVVAETARFLLPLAGAWS